jgi:hypothetical protein
MKIFKFLCAMLIFVSIPCCAYKMQTNQDSDLWIALGAFGFIAFIIARFAD